MEITPVNVLECALITVWLVFCSTWFSPHLSEKITVMVVTSSADRPKFAGNAFGTCLDSITRNSNKVVEILCDLSKNHSKPMYYMLTRSMSKDKTINNKHHMSLFRNRNVKIHVPRLLLQQISFRMICEAR